MTNEGVLPPDFRTLFESVPGLYMVLNPKLSIVAATDAFLQATRTRREEILGRFVFDIFPDNPGDPSADAVSNSTASFQRVLREGVTDVLTVQRLDIRHSEMEGGGWETRFWNVSNAPILAPDGSVAFILQRVEDLTQLVLLQQQEPSRLADALHAQTEQMRAEIAERRRAENALRESEERLQLVLDAAGVGTWDFDPLTGRLDWSARCKAIFGLPPDAEVTYPAFLELLHPDDRDRTDRLVESALNSADPERFETEYRIVWPDGSRRWVISAGRSLFASGQAEPRAVRFIGVVLDVTARRRGEEVKRESERRYRSLFANSLDAVLFTAQSGTIEQANPAALQLFGMTEEEICRMGRNGVVDVTDPRVDASLRNRRLTGRLRTEMTMLRKDGTRFEAEVSSVLMDEIGHSFVIIRDVTERNRQLDALRASQEQLRQRVEELEALTSVAPVAIWVAHDPAGDRITGNPMASQLFEATPEDNVSAKVTPVRRFFENGRELPLEELPIHYSLAHGVEVRDRELEVLFPSGRRIVMIGNASPLRDSAGNVRGCVAAYIDITERKAIMEQLRASELQLRTLSDNLPEAVLYRFTHSASGSPHFEFISAGIEPLTGFSAAEFLEDASLIEKLVVPEDLERLRVATMESRTGLLPFEIEIRRKHRHTGDVRWALLRSTPRRDEDGSTAWEGIDFDITKRKQVEADLERSEALYRGIARNLPDGLVCVVDAEMRCLVIDGPLAHSWGLDAKKLEGRPVLEATDPEIRDRVNQHFRRALAGETASYETEVRGRMILSQYAPLRADSGAVVGGILLAVDISERKRAEDRLRQSQKLESIGLLAGGVAHDFNNLLVGVIGNASLALDLLPATHPAVELVQAVIRTGEQAAHLTRQMLAYAGKGKFVVEPLDLSAIVPEMVALVQPSIARKIDVRLDLGQRLPFVEADRGQVQQVLMNLLLNAAEAIGSSEGLITVRTGLEQIDAAFSRTNPEAADLRPGEYVYLEVRDTGQGMDDATRARIFDPFFSTKFTGRGLGLAAVAGIVRGHKGAILVDTKLGAGTRFTVLLPAVPAIPPREAAEEASATLRGAGTILVVDDEPMVCKMAKLALERFGYTVIIAGSGEEAIDIFRRHPGEIALVILDLSMPKMSGEETLPELRRIRPAVKVLLSSGYSEGEAMNLFRGQLVSGFVQKPYTSRAIAEKVKLALG